MGPGWVCVAVSHGRWKMGETSGDAVGQWHQGGLRGRRWSNEERAGWLSNRPWRLLIAWSWEPGSERQCLGLLGCADDRRGQVVKGGRHWAVV